VRREGAPAPTLALMSLGSGLEPARPRAAFLELARGPLLPDPALGSLIASLNRFLSGGNAVALEELID
jgi:hypothetical protein